MRTGCCPLLLHGACRAKTVPWGRSHGSATFLCPSAECSVTGDIHFTTFDGRRYTFPATCQYILAKSRSSGTFTVTLQNAPCGLVRARDHRPNPASHPFPVPFRYAGEFRAGPQVFPQPTHPAVCSFWAEPRVRRLCSSSRTSESHFRFLDLDVLKKFLTWL